MSDVDAVADAALAAVAAELPDGRVAFETGAGVGPVMLQYCCALIRPDAIDDLMAIAPPPAGQGCLDAAWHSRHPWTRVMFGPVDDPVVAMRDAARRSDCQALLLSDVPGDVRPIPAAAGDEPPLRQPFLSPDFVAALGGTDDTGSLLAAAAHVLARRVYSPQDS